jgi:hypothetical protein
MPEHVAASGVLILAGSCGSRGYNRDVSGGEGDRTPDLVNAIHALSQLSYAPEVHAVDTDTTVSAGNRETYP